MILGKLRGEQSDVMASFLDHPVWLLIAVMLVLGLIVLKESLRTIFVSLTLKLKSLALQQVIVIVSP